MDEMSLRHVQNALAMVERMVEDLYDGPPGFNGEMAQDYAMAQWEQAYGSARSAQTALKAELSRRAHGEATR